MYQLKLEETLYKKAPKDAIAKASTRCMHVTAQFVLFRSLAFGCRAGGKSFSSPLDRTLLRGGRGDAKSGGGRTNSRSLRAE